MMPKQEPQRSCLGCRQVKDKKDLVRFVMSPDKEIVPDLAARLPGRGAYTCPGIKCLVAAVSKKQFNRAFKAETTRIGADCIIEKVTTLIEERIASFIALANKAGKVISGTDMVIDALRKGKSGVVVIARDASPDISDKISHAASKFGARQIRLLDKERLAGLLGKEQRSAASIEKCGLAETMIKELHKYRNFFEGGAQER